MLYDMLVINGVVVNCISRDLCRTIENYFVFALVAREWVAVPGTPDIFLGCVRSRLWCGDGVEKPQYGPDMFRKLHAEVVSGSEVIWVFITWKFSITAQRGRSSGCIR